MNLLCAECLVGWENRVPTETPAATLVDGDALCAECAARRAPKWGPPLVNSGWRPEPDS